MSFNPVIMSACIVVVVVSVLTWSIFSVSICIIKYMTINITYTMITSSNIFIRSENFALHHRSYIVFHRRLTPFCSSTFTNKIILVLLVFFNHILRK